VYSEISDQESEKVAGSGGWIQVVVGTQAVVGTHAVVESQLVAVVVVVVVG
jgi:hypothetical protein